MAKKQSSKTGKGVNLIKHIGVGKKKAKHSTHIAARIGLQQGNTERPTRTLITESIVEENYPIGSTPNNGYFLIDSDDECNEVVAMLEQRIAGMRLRVKGIQRGWAKRKRLKKKGESWPK